MPIFEVTRVVLETQVIRAKDEEEAKRLMSGYAADEVNATVNEVAALRLPDETPVPTELPEAEKKSVIIAGSPTEGFVIVGPFDYADDAVEHAGAEEGFSHTSWWVTDLHPPRVERP